MGQVILVLGGARSGKSTLAENIASNYSKVLYIATAEAGDEEMALRIAKHRERRPSHWQTGEEPVHVAALLTDRGNDYDVVLIDCLTLLVSNWLALPKISSQGTDEQIELILGRLQELLDAAQKIKAKVILVSNEVGMAIVPLNPLARQYRDIVGLANQRVASRAGKVLLTVAGITVDMKKLAVGTEQLLED